MIYLASPYSHADQSVRECRFHAACCAAARLIREGHTVFSPIVHSHPLTKHGLPGDWDFWNGQSREQLMRCDELVVLTLDGWEESAGVQAEIGIAEELGMPVRYHDPTARLAPVAKEADR